MMSRLFFFFFFNDTATTEIYTLSLHDALPIYAFLMNQGYSLAWNGWDISAVPGTDGTGLTISVPVARNPDASEITGRSEEHTSELQSPCNLVCRLLLEKKKKSSAPQRAS